MPTSRRCFALLAALTITACLSHAGHDVSLTPVVRRGPRGSGTFAVSTASGAQVAAFAVEDQVGGWVLHFLGAAESMGELKPATYRAPMTRSPIPTIVRTTTVFGADACAMGIGGPPAGNGNSPGNSWTCSGFGASLPAMSRRIIQFSQPDGNPQYVVLVATASHLPSERWSALADSLGTLSVLATAPDRLGRLAFGEDSTARWVVSLATLPLSPSAHEFGPPWGLGYFQLLKVGAP